ncbi:MAG: polynucleotide adenylyltransferase PcnB [Burkholderiaceae bacterium]
MIRKFINRMLRRKGPHASVRKHARRHRASDLGISHTSVSSAALRTCEGLQKAGFKAYVVGGGVRDLLIDARPKDFDVATDATPQDVNKLFRRSRIIGRRFQIVHVIFGRETIEVSTFRALQTDAETDAHGRVLRDNVWGNQEEDAARRDFTINALYYDPIAEEVLDYHDGVRDMQKRVMRMIGDPETRYREDPVRMLRVARFAAKLGFEIETKTARPMQSLAPLIKNVPSARLFDEMLKLLMSGSALDCLHQLRKAGLHHGLLPLLDVILEQPDGERFITAALAKTDERIRAEKSVSPGFLFATLLWQTVKTRWQANEKAGEHQVPALMMAIDTVLDDQAGQLAIQKRFTADMREIWSMQPRFERRHGQAPYRLIEHIRFRAAYDFFLLRGECGELDPALCKWWVDFAEGDAGSRHDLMAKKSDDGGRSGTSSRSRSRSRNRRRRSPMNADQASLDAAARELQSHSTPADRAGRGNDE